MCGPATRAGGDNIDRNMKLLPTQNYDIFPTLESNTSTWIYCISHGASV